MRQVIAVVPKTPWAAKVSRSAWMPAPAPLSEPAMLRAEGRAEDMLVSIIRKGRPDNLLAGPL